MLHNAMGVLGSGYFSITKVYDPTSLVLREGGGCHIFRSIMQHLNGSLVTSQ